MKPHITKRNGAWCVSHGRGQTPIITGIHPLTALYNYNKVKAYSEYQKSLIKINAESFHSRTLGA